VCKFSGDPYYVTVKCTNCTHDFFHIRCSACDQISKFKGVRKDCQITCHSKKLEYRFCSSCQDYNIYQPDQPNACLYCNCGKLVSNGSGTDGTGYPYSDYSQLFLSGYETKVRPVPKSHKNKNKNKKVTMELKCDLEDIFKEREVKCRYGSKEYAIPMKRSYKEGTKILFENQNTIDGMFYNAYDIEFTVKFKAGDIKVVGSNLIYDVGKASFKKGKKYKITIPHPENELIIVVDDDIISKGRILFPNRGIGGNGKRDAGDFIVNFV
jgi:hypothetical protein